ncbi:hypothetical protein EDI_289830 [Entamoeba dispar SAW760]|uniref:Uncharacterized protein n=1 Tax=Entamoeba dispar (strain ATCC PRA-260 / SAW760) TaxID=370354 RepID=B0EVD7_ENTDS|nr:uncharacterized protein EDI_289830 [Entamoeba dispar SAW760]EDR21549.1 hypothetical protein EDI_289830 [Entamoeba dispar SAW760]|eukprot:EDR21549.1 hypothetical protein EDI_289830 [Entamoeba dispar SAW760]
MAFTVNEIEQINQQIQNTENKIKEPPEVTNLLENTQECINQRQQNNFCFEEKEEISKEPILEKEECNEENETKEGSGLIFTEWNNKPSYTEVKPIICAPVIQDKASAKEDIEKKEEKTKRKKNPNTKLKNEWKKLKKSLGSHQKKILDAYIDYKVEKKVNKIIQQIQKEETLNQYEVPKKKFEVHEKKIKHFIKHQQKDMKDFIQKQISYQNLMYQYPYFYFPYVYYPQPYNVNGIPPYFFNQFNSIEQPSSSYNHQYCCDKTCPCLNQENQPHTPTHPLSSTPIHSEVEQTVHPPTIPSSQTTNHSRKLESQTKLENESLTQQSPNPPFKPSQNQQPDLVYPFHQPVTYQQPFTTLIQPQHQQPKQINLDPSYYQYSIKY